MGRDRPHHRGRDELVTRVVIATQYWRPYRSGLTLMEAAVAEALAAQGHEVTAVVGRHDPALPAREVINGVEVVRVPVRARIDRALVAPSLVPTAARLARAADVFVIPLPLPEAAPLALAVGRGTRVVVHFHCDPELERGGLAARAALAAMDGSARVALRRADTITVTSRDYAEHSRVMADRAAQAETIPPMVGEREWPSAVVDPSMVAAMAPPPALRVGFLGRLTHEKGVDRLIEAAGRMSAPVQVVIAGDSAEAAGRGLWPTLESLAVARRVDVRYLGPLDDDQVAPFLSAIDVLALPSVNALEAWGRVQAEAMLCGTPVIASALPGVRTLITATGMGLLVEPGDIAGLRDALDEVAADRDGFIRTRAEVITDLGLDTALDRHVAAVLG
jgi:glycosyltransferase involved in cell wall biosynthesis